MSTACFGYDYSFNSTTSCGNDVMNGEDFVFAYNSPGGEIINVVLSNTSPNVGLYVLNGCPDNPGSSCISIQKPIWHIGNPSLCGIALANPGTYYIIVDKTSGFTNFDIDIQRAPPSGQDCANSYSIPSIPFSQTSLSSRCYMNDYTPNTICNGTIMDGEDFIFEYTSLGGEMINLQLVNTSNFVGLFVLNDCPTAAGANCIASASGVNPFLCSVSLAAPGNYYFIVDRSYGFTPFDIYIEQSNLPGANCSNPYLIDSIPFAQTEFTTACYGSDYDNNNACQSTYNGEEFVFEYTATEIECLNIDISMATQGGLFVMDGCPNILGTNCIAQFICDNTNGCNNTSVAVTFSPGTYYIVVSSQDSSASQFFDLQINQASSDPTITPPQGPFCELHNHTFEAADEGGTWSGPGIINSQIGTFDATIAGLGIHTIIYSFALGEECGKSDSIQIEVIDCECNLDFERGDFFRWQAYTGECCPIVANTSGFVIDRHTIMSSTNTDGPTLGALPVVPFGGGIFSARLGNSSAGREAEKLNYQFFVTPQNAIFGFQYAIVLNDGGHQPESQARFEVSMTDMAGDTIPCGSVDFVALNLIGGGITQPIIGFETVGNVQYKPWSTAIVDLTSYIGQTVTVEFRAGDCAIGAHFGYGYINGFCESVKIKGNNFCESADSIILTVLPGFLSYQWNTFPPQFTESITIHNPQHGDTISVTLTPTPGVGCPVTLTTILKRLEVIIDAGMDDTICANSSYSIAATSAGDAHLFSWASTGTGSFDYDTLLKPIYTPSSSDSSAGSVQLILTAHDSTYTCSASDTLTLFIRKALSLTPSVTNPACNQSDGKICIKASGGPAPFNYLWSDPDNQTDSCASNLFAGIYTVKVTDANNNCATTATIIVRIGNLHSVNSCK